MEVSLPPDSSGIDATDAVQLDWQTDVLPIAMRTEAALSTTCPTLARCQCEEVPGISMDNVRGVLEVYPLNLEATWRLDTADIAGKGKGDQVVSHELRLWGYRCQLYFYPQGHTLASEGFSSLYIWPSTIAALDLEMAGTSHHINITQETLKLMKETNLVLRGHHDFCKIPDMSNPVEIHVKFKHIDGKDVKTLAEKAAIRPRKFQEAATRIQALWRGVEARRREKLRHAEERRCHRQSRELTAALHLQLAWRLCQRRLQRRWHGRLVQVQSTPYDAILAFESLSQFLSTGDIRFLQHAESKLQVASAARFRIVAVVGLFDKGKTFLINKLFGVNLPSGKLHTTKGLSFLWIEERRPFSMMERGVIVDVDPVKLEATWRLEAADVADTKNGEKIVSPQLQLWRHSFRIEIYPCGEHTSEGYFSVFVYAPVKALIDIDLAGETQRLDITEEALKRTKNGALGWGIKKFCRVVDLTNPLDIRVRFGHIEGKGSKLLSEEAEVLRRKPTEAIKVQALWRGVETRRREALRRAEEQRRRRQSRELNAALCLQLAWRLYQQRLQRRWHSKMVQAQSTPYDAILAFESLSQFLSTGEIRFLQHAESKLQVASAARFRIVAVVGLFDKGKTFLINKLFGVNLPSGKLHTTKGLSFLWI
ncbi:unnamed protein product, partial [Symbiodinium sp. CCMP2456]